jgi:hypothetical protein
MEFQQLPDPILQFEEVANFNKLPQEATNNQEGREDIDDFTFSTETTLQPTVGCYATLRYRAANG